MRRIVFSILSALSLVLTLAAWHSGGRGVPLSREYVEFMQQTRDLDPQERQHQLEVRGIRKFDSSGVPLGPEFYIWLAGPFVTAGCLLVLFWKKPNPQGGTDGEQPPSSQTNRALQAAASRRSP